MKLLATLGLCGLTAAAIAVAQAPVRNAPPVDETQFVSYFSVATPEKNTKIRRHWRELLGRRVQVEGFAWGAHEKGMPNYVVLNGARIYVRPANFAKDDLDGKLVRVTGSLDVLSQPAARPKSQGFSTEFRAYVVRNAAVTTIERVSDPSLNTLD